MKEEVSAILQLASERNLPSLLIGGNAMILLGYLRNTADLDLLVPDQSRSQWLDLPRELGYRFFHGTPAFAQFEAPAAGGPPVDLMFVDDATWEKLFAGAREVDLAGHISSRSNCTPPPVRPAAGRR